MNIRLVQETLEQETGAAAEGGRQLETNMKLDFFRRYFRARHVYWNVVRELSCYTDRELHDLGIDRADIPGIAEAAAHQG